MRKIITKTLILLTVLFTFAACKQNIDDENETWDYVFSIEDAMGVWENSSGGYDYTVFVTEYYVSVTKRKDGTSVLSKSYFNNDNIYYIKTCKINNKRNKLICPTFGSSIILTK